MRNWLGVLLLSMVLLGGCNIWPKAPKGYDIAGCGFGNFTAAHIAMTAEGLQVDAIAIAPGHVQHLTTDQGAAYKKAFENKEGTHYLNVENLNEEIVLNGNTGAFKINGQVALKLSVFEDVDGSQLDNNAKAQFKACTPIIKGLGTATQN